jgi:hypothetical protein
MKIKNTLLILLLTPLHLLQACNKVEVEERVISLDSLKKTALDNGGEYTEVRILKTYPKQEDSNELSVNMYICKNINANDTVYVFDSSKKVPSFAQDTSIDIGVSIDKREVKTFVTPPKNRTA